LSGKVEATVEVSVSVDIPWLQKFVVSEDVPYARLGSNEPFEMLAERIRAEIKEMELDAN